MSPLGSDVITTSASATASVPLSETCAPLSEKAPFIAATGSKPRTVCPAATRFAAIGRPCGPTPRTQSSTSGLLCGCAGTGGPCRFAGSARGSPTDDHAHDFVGSLEDSMHPKIADDLLQPILAQIAV